MPWKIAWIGLFLLIGFVSDAFTQALSPFQKNEEQELQAIYPGYRGVVADYRHVGREALECWMDRKFGMRIHWGVNSILGMDGVPGLIESEEFRRVYETLYQVFNPSEFDADEWAALAERAGMKYFVLSVMHGGVYMFDTKTTRKTLMRKPISRWSTPPSSEVIEVEISHDIMDTPFGRDVLAELVTAFRKLDYGIGIHPGAFPWTGGYEFGKYNRKDDPEFKKAAMVRYRKMVRELCTNYGKIDQFAFDTGNIGREGIPPDDVIEAIKEVRSLQPEALFRRRGLGVYGDFQTPEHWIPDEQETSGEKKLPTRPWQAIEQLGTRWFYQPNDTYHPKEWVLETLIKVTALGGNFMIGISPLANGKFPEPTIERLEWAGKWLAVNGKAIYKTRGMELWRENTRETKKQLPWKEGEGIYFTHSKDEKVIYAIHIGWPGKTLRLKSVRALKGSQIKMLGVFRPLAWRQNMAELTIEIPDEIQLNPPCEYAYAFEIRLKD